MCTFAILQSCPVFISLWHHVAQRQLIELHYMTGLDLYKPSLLTSQEMLLFFKKKHLGLAIRSHAVDQLFNCLNSFPRWKKGGNSTE